MDKSALPIIGVDAKHAFSSQRTGTENYAYNLLEAMSSLDSHFRFRYYVDTDSAIPSWVSDTDEVRRINWSRMWTQGGLALETWSRTPELMFIPAHVIPLFKKPNLPVVVTVHDLRTEFLPQHSSIIQKIYLNRFTEMIRTRLASHVVAVSASTKKDVVDLLKVSDEKISIVYEGVDMERFNFELKKKRKKISEIRKRYGVSENYILFVGTVQPRKNLARLIEAFSNIQNEFDGDLVLAGKRGWLADEIYSAPVKYCVEDKVRFIDYVQEDDLPYLYAGAKLFAFPSLYEGFGLPILESLSVGTPVVTSNVSSMPEVGGDIAIYVEPNDVASISGGLLKGIDLDVDKNQVLDHVKRFNWKKAAQETLGVFDKVLSNENS